MSSTGGSISSYIGGRAALVAAAVAMALGALVVPVVTGGGSGSVSCDQTITTNAALQTALTTASNGGKTLCVTANITGSTITSGTDMTGTVPVRVVAQPNDMTIDMVSLDLNGANDITIEGFEFNNQNFGTWDNGTGQITVKKNYFHDLAGKSAIRVANTTSSVGLPGLVITGNKFWRISCTATLTAVTAACASNPAGYAMYASGSTGASAAGLVFTYNNVEVGGDTFDVKNADGVELSGLDGFELGWNIFKNIHGCEELTGANCTDDGPPSHNPHVDTLGLFAGSSDGNIHDNRIVDGPDFGLPPVSTRDTMTNNLVVGLYAPNGCMDMNYNSANPSNLTLQQNTFWDCTNGSGLNFAPTGGTSNHADRNLVQDYDPDCNASAWTDSNHNNLFGQSTKTCWPGATNVTSFAPTFTNTTDWDNVGYYIPTNLPGSQDQGYHYVPAGYLNCSC